MPRRRIRLYVPALLLLVTSIAFAFSTGPPASETGAVAVSPAPAEGTCQACHSGNALNLGGTLSILNVPAVYKPDSSYLLTVQLASSQTSGFATRRWGFEITCVSGANGAGFGTLVRSNADTTTTQIVNGAGSFSTRRYVEHTSTGTRTSQASPVSWTFRWVAPSAAASTAQARFFAAGNAANGNGTNSGDFIYTASASSLPPGRISTVASLAFGTVIVGATAQQNLPVSNSATAPAGALQYSLAAPANYSAPAGPFSAAAGAGPNNHTVTMNTGASGSRNGSLAVSSSDPVTPNLNVTLVGAVLDHAQPSLDSTAAVFAETVDLGTLEHGAFRDTAAVVANLGFSSGFQSQLQVTDATITGGDGRFSIPGGFSIQFVGLSPLFIPVRFDDVGGTSDSTYSATLTIQSADQSLPGALGRPDLLVTLTAKILGGPVGVTITDSPTATRLLPALPNPAQGRSSLGFDLARRGAVSLEVFDARGRRVRTLAFGSFEVGRHRFDWDGSDDRGSRVSAGIYFFRLTAPGFSSSGRLALLD